MINIKKLSALSRLEFNTSEDESLSKDFGGILDAMSTLDMINLSGVEPLHSITTYLVKPENVPYRENKVDVTPARELTETNLVDGYFHAPASIKRDH